VIGFLSHSDGGPHVSHQVKQDTLADMEEGKSGTALTTAQVDVVPKPKEAPPAVAPIMTNAIAAKLPRCCCSLVLDADALECLDSNQHLHDVTELVLQSVCIETVVKFVTPIIKVRKSAGHHKGTVVLPRRDPLVCCF